MDTIIQTINTQPVPQNIGNPPTPPIINDPQKAIQSITPNPPKGTIFKKVMIIVLSLLGIIILAFTWYVYISRPQFSGDKLNTKGNNYPDSMKVPFMQTCKIGEKNCQCVLKYLQDNYSYNEFSKDGENDDPLLMEAASYCKSVTTP